MKKSVILFAVLCIILVAPFCFTSSNIKLDKKVTEHFSEGKVKVIVIMSDSDNQMAAAGISNEKINHKFSSIKGFSAELSENEIENLADNPNVKEIYYDTPVQANLQDSAPLTNTTFTWAQQLSGINITGKGLSACVIDTGVNYSHPDLGNCSRQFYTLNGTNISYVLESAHNYTNNFDFMWQINYTGFSNIAVHFANISLETHASSLDRILIYDYQMKEIADYYGNNSVVRDFWTPFSGNSTIYVRLITDSSITSYGFYIDQIRNGTTNSTFDWRNCSKVIYGWDFVNNDADPYDDNHHGTHVSGIIAANGSIKGIAPDSTIVSAKALDSAGNGYTSDILYAMEFCINNSARYNISVISMSLGGSATYNGYCDSQGTNSLFVPYINNANSKNISIVISSGNNGNISAMSSPACLSGVISVGATDKSDNIASYSNRNNLTTVLAPGSSINSTYLSASGYALDTGTSMACPHVAAEIILLQQAKFIQTGKYNSVSTIKNLLANGKNITDSNGLNYTRIDVYKAYLAEINDSQAPTFTWVIRPNVSDGSSVSVSLTATDNVGITIYNITLNSQSFQMNNIANLYSYTIIPTGPANITYNVTFADALGNTNITDSVVLQINDTTSPRYSNVTNQNLSYQSSYQINATWTDNMLLSRVWLSFNKNSTLQINYTASNSSNSSSLYNVTLAGLAAGNYSFQWFANDTAGNQNQTSIFNLTINQADPRLNISLNASGIVYLTDIIVENGTLVNITAAESGEGPVILYLNGTAINSGLNSISNISQINSTVNVTAFYNSTQNYSSSTITRYITIEISGTAPKVSKITPANNSYVTSQIVNFSINATDSSLKNATVFLWNSSNSLIQSNSTDISGIFNTTNWTYNLSDGNYVWNAMATDTSNNINRSLNNFSFIVDTIVPSLTLSGSTSIYNDESTVITCSATDANFQNLVLNIGTSQKNHTETNGESISYQYFGSNGTASINCTAFDNANHANTHVVTITVTQRTTSASSPGQSPSPSSSPPDVTVTTTPSVPAVPVQLTETSQIAGNLIADVPKSIEITSSLASAGITEIQITSSVNISLIILTLKQLSAADVPINASGRIYNYFNISLSVNASSIRNATINFQVNNSWISENDIDKNTVKLKHLNENWADLKTEKLSEDSENTYYSAVTESFSLFAIAAENNSATAEKPAAKMASWLMLVIIIASIVLVVLILIAAGVIKFSKKSQLGAVISAK